MRKIIIQSGSVLLLMVLAFLVGHWHGEEITEDKFRVNPSDAVVLKYLKQKKIQDSILVSKKNQKILELQALTRQLNGKVLALTADNAKNEIELIEYKRKIQHLTEDEALNQVVEKSGGREAGKIYALPKINSVNILETYGERDNLAQANKNLNIIIGLKDSVIRHTERQVIYVEEKAEIIQEAANDFQTISIMVAEENKTLKQSARGFETALAIERSKKKRWRAAAVIAGGIAGISTWLLAN